MCHFNFKWNCVNKGSVFLISGLGEGPVSLSEHTRSTKRKCKPKISSGQLIFSSPGICRQSLTPFSITSPLKSRRFKPLLLASSPGPHPFSLLLFCIYAGTSSNIPVYPAFFLFWHLWTSIHLSTSRFFIYLTVQLVILYIVLLKNCSEMCFSVLWTGNIYVVMVLITQQKLSMKVFIIFIVSSHSYEKYTLRKKKNL